MCSADIADVMLSNNCNTRQAVFNFGSDYFFLPEALTFFGGMNIWTRILHNYNFFWKYECIFGLRFTMAAIQINEIKIYTGRDNASAILKKVNNSTTAFDLNRIFLRAKIL